MTKQLLKLLPIIFFANMGYAKSIYEIGFTAPAINGTTGVSFPVAGDIILDTSGDPDVFKGFNGSNWVQMDAASKVTTTTSGVERIERATITWSAGVPSESASWIDSVDDDATGRVTLNITSGKFSARPVCSCTVQYNGSSTGALCLQNINSVDSASEQQFEILNISGAGADPAGLNIVCVGPSS